jgi:hypothetical protein
MVARNNWQIRAPIRRQHAQEYLLLTLFSFGVTVSLTRLFLWATGYPQIGGGELHIAHVLWGGLLLFGACLLPLIFANHWALTCSALVGGAGVGLFIDEVGKFITQNNDYFYPSAAPIIYVLFLLTVLVYTQVKQPRARNSRTIMYGLLQDMEEVLDHDLSEPEQARMLAHLHQVEQTSQQKDLANLAGSLRRFLSRKDTPIVPDTPPFLTRLRDRYLDWEAHWLTENRMRPALGAGLVAMGSWALIFPLRTILTLRNPADLQLLLTQLMEDRLVRNASGLNWFEARVGLEGGLGLIIFVAGFLLLIGKTRLAMRIAYPALLVILVIGNLLLFYFDQFSTIANAAVEFLLLSGVWRYRVRFLDPPADTDKS